MTVGVTSSHLLIVRGQRRKLSGLQRPEVIDHRLNTNEIAFGFDDQKRGPDRDVRRTRVAPR